MLDELNSDCQLIIIKYLQLNDQIALCEASKNHSNRLYTNVIFSWEHQRCFKLDEYNIERFEEMPKMLDIFLSSISETVQKLILQWVTLKFLKRWKNYTFPSMRTLKYLLVPSYGSKHEADEALQIMSNLFPGLLRVTPHGDFYCDQLSKWTQLRELNLVNWFSNYKSQVSPIEVTQCKMLEKLQLNHYFRWPGIYDQIMALPKLYKLSIILTNHHALHEDIAVELLENRGNDVYKMTLSDINNLYYISRLRKASNLRHLTLARVHFSIKKMCKLIANLKQLERLDFIDFHSWLNEKELWRIVAKCPSLKILNISGMKLCENFFELDRSAMEKTLNNRLQPVILNCYNTYKNEQLMRQYFKHPQLKLSFKPSTWRFIDWNESNGMIQLYFKPLLAS